MLAVRPEISVVVPVFNERECLAEMCERCSAALALTGRRWELVFVDDGSTDGSSDLLCQFAREGAGIHVVQLSRNFGHQAALTAGLAASRGAGVILIDGDLQDPPELIPALVINQARSK
jgi:dolichol-phosphate mannosyltransferase